MGAAEETENFGIQESAEDSGAEICRFLVGDANAGKRFDAYLVEKLPRFSRARLQRLIEQGDALIDSHAAKSSQRVRAGNRVEVDFSSIIELPENLTPENIPLDVLYEDEAIIVVNKPAGMVVHPGAGVSSGTLANALAFHFQNLSKQAGAIRPGIVHRLDKDTSGLLVVAKSEAAHENLAEQFRRREVFKQYVALVHGRIKDESGRIEQPIGRDERNRTRMSVVPKGRGGREALTLYQVRQRFSRFTLLDVEIKTGRTHQIRAHFAWLKHPIVGDPVYGAGRDQNLPDAALRAAIAKLGRQFLHAERLKFRHPQSGAPLKFHAPMPSELREFLAALS